MQLGLLDPSIAGIPQCMCTHPINPMGIHLLRCVHGNEHTGTHDAIRNTFVAVVWDVSFHIGQKQLHALPSTTFNSFYWWIDILLTKEGNCTLANIVITDPMQVDLLLQFYATQRFVASYAIQGKELSQPTPHWSIPPLNNWNVWLFM